MSPNANLKGKTMSAARKDSKQVHDTAFYTDKIAAAIKPLINGWIDEAGKPDPEIEAIRKQLEAAAEAAGITSKADKIKESIAALSDTSDDDVAKAKSDIATAIVAVCNELKIGVQLASKGSSGSKPSGGKGGTRTRIKPEELEAAVAVLSKAMGKDKMTQKQAKARVGDKLSEDHFKKAWDSAKRSGSLQTDGKKGQNGQAWFGK